MKALICDPAGQPDGMAIAPFDKPHPVMRIQPLRGLPPGTLPDTLTTMPALPSLEG